MAETPDTRRAELSVLHIGAGRYSPTDRDHSTFAIWRELATGFRAYTVLGRSTTAEGAVLSEGNLTVHLIPSAKRSEAEFFWGQRHAVKLADRVEADAVVAQSPMLGGWAGLAIRRRRKAPLMVEVHSDDFVGRAALGSRKWLIQQLSAPVLRRTDRIRVLSQRMADAMRERYGEGLAPKLAVLPPRVNLARFTPKSDWRSEGPLKVIMVGAVNENKGQKRLIAALAKAAIPIELWIAGDGPELEACRALATAHADRLTVKFFGRVNHEKVSELLTAADVFIMYSKSEGTPRAIMEAMATGLPVVTSNAGFCADLLDDGKEGFVLGPEPDRDVVERLTRLHHDPALRRALGEAARARAVKDYDSVQLYARYKRLIAGMVRA